MSHEDAGSFDLSPEVGALNPDAPVEHDPVDTGTNGGEPDPGPIEPITGPMPPATNVEQLYEEMQAEEQQLEYLAENPNSDPTIPPEPTTQSQGSHPDPSSVPPDAPTDAHYDHDGNLEQGEAPTSHVIGDPDDAAKDWTFQGANGYCGPNSLSMLLEQATGHKISEGDVSSWAISNNEMTHLPPSEDSPPGVPSLHYGMLPQQATDTLNALGQEYGVTASLQSGDMGDLESALKNGHEVMIEVDDEKLWHEQGVPDSGQANHFVVVTGFDPSTNTVFLNDPGTPDGREESVPLSDFNQAWKASDNAMITVDQGSGDTGDSGGAVHGQPDYHDMSSWSGPILLPVVMGSQS